MLGISTAGTHLGMTTVHWLLENVGNAMSKHGMNKFLNKEMLLMLLM